MRIPEEEMKRIISVYAKGHQDLEEALETARGYRALLSRSHFSDKGVKANFSPQYWDKGNYQTPKAPTLEELDGMMR